METVGELRKRFDHHLARKPVRGAPQFGDAGLLFGADTLLFATEAADTEPSDTQGGTRLLALLRAGYGFPVPATVVGNVRRAARTKQANRQLRAAQAAGRRLEWWFYESDVADFAREVFREAGFGDDIKVFHHDYPGNDAWPYPPSATWAKGRRTQ